MKGNIYLNLFFILIFLSCTKEKEPNQGFTYSDFENNLKSDMNYNSIVAAFGQPSNDIGSGIHIYVYQLTDSSEIWIGYADKIIYARHMDKNHQIINSMIDSFTYNYFKDNLNADMTYNAIVEKFGQPSNDIGSGIHIYVYLLTDSTEIWIGYVDKIIYARHLDKNHQIIENII